MKVLHINRNYLGTALHQTMIEKLNMCGVTNSVFVPIGRRENGVITPGKDVIVSECFTKLDRVIFSLKQKKIREKLESMIDVDSFDLIHAYTLFTDGNCARKLSKKYGIPYVVAVRNTDVNVFFKKLPYLRNRGVEILCDALRIFFLSETYQKQVLDKYIPPKYREKIREKSCIIPNGIDDFWHENETSHINNIRDSGRIKLIYAGKIDRNKNIPLTLAAMDILVRSGVNVHLSVIGKVVDDSEFSRIKNKVNVSYFNSMPKEELIEKYRENDIFVMPSKAETFGLVYAEAMSQGLPIIYTRGQGFDGQFPDGFVGYSVDSRSPEEVANAILSIADNYDTLSGNCNMASRKFTWDTIVNQYKKIYLDIGLQSAKKKCND